MSRERTLELLSELYDEVSAAALTERLWRRLPKLERDAERRNDCLLITYADSIREPGRPPLQTLRNFLNAHLADVCGRVHLLPFYPSSSDDGFAVIDYRMVDHHVGSWGDIEALGNDFDLMYDLVINHCSRENLWFADFVGGREPGRNYFITLPEDTDTRTVARPRSTPLVSPVHTYAGIRHVWNTFSDDQIDLDFSNPQVVYEMIDVLFFYIERGARLIRLDAIGYLWKRLGTSCLNLAEVHTFVKLLRLLVAEVDPDIQLVTETNVPHAENVAYLGQGDEAHMVYQFSLPPLLLYSFVFGDSSYLQNWASALEAPPPGATYLNFIASHDGIGVRPLEGWVPDEEVDRLVDRMHERGGFVSMRDAGTAGQRPYEINISLISAFGGADGLPAFLASHAVCLSFLGSPALYIHSLLGTENDLRLVEETGRTRSINRRKWRLNDLEAALADPESLTAQALARLSVLVRRRNRQAAFHPSAAQRILPTASALFAFERTAETQSILVAVNLTHHYERIPMEALGLEPGRYLDHVSGNEVGIEEALVLLPHQAVWLDTTTLRASA